MKPYYDTCRLIEATDTLGEVSWEKSRVNDYLDWSLIEISKLHGEFNEPTHGDQIAGKLKFDNI